jgi:DNA-binding CsgD family transcriptional regulator
MGADTLTDAEDMRAESLEPPEEVPTRLSDAAICRFASFSCLFTWLLLFPEMSLLGSTTVYAHAFDIGVLTLAVFLVWFCLSCLAHVKIRPLLQTLFGLVACICGIAFACSDEWAMRLVMYAMTLLFAVFPVYEWCQTFRRLSLDAVVRYVSVGLIVAAAFHFFIWFTSGVVGASENVGTYMSIGLVMLACLPLAGGVFSLLAAYAPRMSRIVGSAPYATADEEVHARSGRGSTAAPLRSLSWVLVALFAVASFVVFFFNGFMVTPYLFDSVALGNQVYGVTLLVAVLAYAVLRLSRRAFKPTAVYLCAVVALLAALTGLLMLALSGTSSHALALAILLFACVGFFSVNWMSTGMSFEGDTPSWLDGLVMMLLMDGYFAVRFFGVAFKQQIGYDSETIMSVVLVVVVFLLLAFLVASVATSSLAQRMLGEVSQEKESAGHALEKVRDTHESYLARFDLSQREMQVALLLAEGKTMDEVAQQTRISVNTVRFHMKNIYKKVGVSGKKELRQKLDAAIGE